MESEGPLLCSQLATVGPHLDSPEFSSHICMIFDVLTAVRVSIAVFWVVTPHCLVGDYRRIGGTKPWTLRRHVASKCFYPPLSLLHAKVQNTVNDFHSYPVVEAPHLCSFSLPFLPSAVSDINALGNVCIPFMFCSWTWKVCRYYYCISFQIKFNYFTGRILLALVS